MADDELTLAGGPVRRAREWTARRYADVQAVLADSRFEVAGAGPGGPPGTLPWLRASVSRFANGGEHRQRRARAIAELRQLEPGPASTGTRRGPAGRGRDDRRGQAGRAV